MIPFTASFIASILSVVPQTNVVEKIGDFKCGNGCKYQIRFEQLSPMEEIGGGWRKVKLIKRTFFGIMNCRSLNKKDSEILQNIHPLDHGEGGIMQIARLINLPLVLSIIQ